MKSESKRDLRSNSEDYLLTDVCRSPCDYDMEKYDVK